MKISLVLPVLIIAFISIGVYAQVPVDPTMCCVVVHGVLQPPIAV